MWNKQGELIGMKEQEQITEVQIELNDQELEQVVGGIILVGPPPVISGHHVPVDPPVHPRGGLVPPLDNPGGPRLLV
jgi:bacteriocin-like protein